MQLVEKTGRGEVGESKGRKAAGGKEPGAGPAGHPHPPPQTPAHFTLTGPRSVLTCRSHRHLCFSQCCTISRLGKHTFQTFIEGTDKNAEENRVNAWAMSRSRGLPLGCERHRITPMCAEPPVPVPCRSPVSTQRWAEGTNKKGSNTMDP